MAHQEQYNFVCGVSTTFPQYFVDKKVLEVGSLDINGSVRGLFRNCDYIGLDVGEGAGVDIVCSGHLYDAPSESFDTILSTECFEHNPHWLETFKNMIRLCKPNGLIFFTCATDGRAEHGTSRTDAQSSPLSIAAWGDYYRNLNENDFRNEIDFNSNFTVHNFSTNANPYDLYFWGIKK